MAHLIGPERRWRHQRYNADQKHKKKGGEKSHVSISSNKRPHRIHRSLSWIHPPDEATSANLVTYELTIQTTGSVRWMQTPAPVQCNGERQWLAVESTLVLNGIDCASLESTGAMIHSFIHRRLYLMQAKTSTVYLLRRRWRRFMTSIRRQVLLLPIKTRFHWRHSSNRTQQSIFSAFSASAICCLSRRCPVPKSPMISFDFVPISIAKTFNLHQFSPSLDPSLIHRKMSGISICYWSWWIGFFKCLWLDFN